ncbi:TIGR01841 family phasin [Sphingomonas sanguinis]|uniref:TIGR01841 family phasin n=1 Tax=Sphingomonas sanguinis TaxID=33051 RepID=A0ABU5LQZ9_9SPHN|nr:TIGR01841 family phasin [Sphingomonas sanguinis]MDZ7282347.1 TIGR01841 family phasin [Sphingomonas sanguinis]
MDKDKPTVPAAKAVAKPRRVTKPVAAKTLPGLPSDPKPAVTPPVAKTVAPAASASPGLPLTSPASAAEKSAAPVAAPVVAKVAKPAPAPKAPAKPVVEAPAPAAKPVEAAKPAASVTQPVAPAAAEPAKPEISSPTAAVSADSKPKDIIMDATSTIENAAKDTAAKTQAFFGDAQARTQAGMEKSAKLFEDMIAFNKANLEAVVESSKIAAKGAETLGQGAADYAKRTFETATQTLQTLSSVKSPTEFMKLQSDFARSAFDSMVAETSRSTEHMMKLAGEIAQPLSNRVAVAAEKMKTVA